MKIAYLINEYPKVSHSFIRREILALERRGFVVQRIAVRGWRGKLPDADDQRERERTQYVLRRGVITLLLLGLLSLLRRPVRFLSAAKLVIATARNSDRSVALHLFYLAEACQVLAWLRQSGATRLHAHFGTNSTDVAMLVHAIGGPPFSFTVHGPEEFLRCVNLREKISRADFVIAISNFGKSQLCLSAKNSTWAKIKVVRCGLEPSFYSASPTPPAGSNRLVCVGRLVEEKGQLLLVEAAARLSAKGVNIELVFVGDGPIRPELEALIRKHGLERRVRITGFVSSTEVRNELLLARALVLPSFSEGLPVVIMEAMSLRRPVLATYVAGIPELVRDGQSGWLFPAGSMSDLMQAIERCLSTPADILQQMGEVGYQSVRARHSIEVETAKLARLFESDSTVLDEDV